MLRIRCEPEVPELVPFAFGVFALSFGAVDATLESGDAVRFPESEDPLGSRDARSLTFLRLDGFRIWPGWRAAAGDVLNVELDPVTLWFVFK